MISFRGCMAALLVLASAATARAEKLYGITEENWFVSWDSNSPQTLIQARALPQTPGVLVAMDVNQVVPGSGPLLLYRQSPGLQTFELGLDHLSYTLRSSNALNDADSFRLGSNFGFEVSRSTGKYRVVTNSRLNLEITPGSPTYATLPDLHYAVGDINAGASPNVTSIAFGKDLSGNEILYGIDVTLNSLVWFTSASGGELQTVGVLGDGGPAEPNVGPIIGFDISEKTGRGYIAAETFNGFGNAFMEVDLATGALLNVTELAGGVKLKALAVPEPATCVLLAIGAGAAVCIYRRKR